MTSLAKSLELAEKALKDIPTARLEALVLLEDLVLQDRSWLLAHPEFELSKVQLKKFNSQISRRAKHEPLAYIRGKSEFYGREFIVNAHTLEPRPETETMIDCLKKIWESVPKTYRILDVGCGSGAIGITVALELKTDSVDLLDIDDQALAIARANCRQYKIGLDCKNSDLLNSVHRSYDIILANLPYVPDSHTINQAAMQEPKHAIFGGPDGLRLYRQLFKQASNQSQAPKYILTESLPFQHQQLVAIARQYHYKSIMKDDFIISFELQE